MNGVLKNRQDLGSRLTVGFLVAGFLGSPLYNTAGVRAQLLGAASVPQLTTVAVLCLCLGLAWRSLLRRDFAWADPARLTWADFDGSRPKLLGRRMLTSWAVRFGAVGYATAVSALLTQLSPALFPLVIALFTGTALLALVTARRAPTPALTWFERLVPFAAVALAVCPPAVQWAAAGAACVGALALLPGPRTSAATGRVDLIQRYFTRLVRRVSLSFLDLWVLLPPGRPVRWTRALAGRFVLVRFVLTGVLARGRTIPLAALLALAVAVLHAVFPAVNPVWWTGIAGYFSALPFAASVAELHRTPGLRRWLNCTDRALKAATVAVLVMFLAGWLGVVVLLGVPFSGQAALVLLVASVAVLRTVTQRAMDFSNIGLVSFFGVLVPAGLLFQLGHGPDLLLLGLVLLGTGMALWLAAPILLGLSAATTFR
jgi:hypothetical protein